MDGIRRKRLCDHRTGPDDAVIPQFHSREENRPSSNPDIISDPNRFFPAALKPNGEVRTIYPWDVAMMTT